MRGECSHAPWLIAPRAVRRDMVLCIDGEHRTVINNRHEFGAGYVVTWSDSRETRHDGRKPFKLVSSPHHERPDDREPYIRAGE